MNRIVSLTCTHKIFMCIIMLTMHHHTSCSEHENTLHVQISNLTISDTQKISAAPDISLHASKVEPEPQWITPLHCVATKEEAMTILKYGPDINAQDIHGQTPIDYMIKSKQFNIAEYLLSQGATTSPEKRVIILEGLKKESEA